MAIFAATYSLVGQEREFTNYNCAITPPDGWSRMTNFPSQPGLFTIFFGKVDKSRLVWLMVDDRHKPAGPVDDRFVAEFEGGVERSGGGKRISGRFTEIDGIKGYERLGYVMVSGKRASTLMQSVPADTRFYSVNGMRFDGNANEDPEIRKFLASFRFIKYPARPTAPSSESAAYQTGYLMGRLAGIGLLIAVGVAIVRVITRRKGKRTIPPPLPSSR